MPDHTVSRSQQRLCSVVGKAWKTKLIKRNRALCTKHLCEKRLGQKTSKDQEKRLWSHWSSRELHGLWPTTQWTQLSGNLTCSVFKKLSHKGSNWLTKLTVVGKKRSSFWSWNTRHSREYRILIQSPLLLESKRGVRGIAATHSKYHQFASWQLDCASLANHSLISNSTVKRLLWIHSCLPWQRKLARRDDDGYQLWSDEMLHT